MGLAADAAGLAEAEGTGGAGPVLGGGEDEVSEEGVEGAGVWDGGEGEGSEVISFSDNRQDTALQAAHMQSLHNRFSFRRTLYTALRPSRSPG